jgi:hypothetical protein
MEISGAAAMKTLASQLPVKIRIAWAEQRIMPQGGTVAHQRHHGSSAVTEDTHAALDEDIAVYRARMVHRADLGWIACRNSPRIHDLVSVGIRNDGDLAGQHAIGCAMTC